MWVIIPSVREMMKSEAKKMSSWTWDVKKKRESSFNISELPKAFFEPSLISFVKYNLQISKDRSVGAWVLSSTFCTVPSIHSSAGWTYEVIYLKIRIPLCNTGIFKSEQVCRRHHQSALCLIKNNAFSALELNIRNELIDFSAPGNVTLKIVISPCGVFISQFPKQNLCVRFQAEAQRYELTYSRSHSWLLVMSGRTLNC